MPRSWFRSAVALWMTATIATGGCRAPQVKAPAAPGARRDPNTAAAIAAATTPTGRPQIPIASTVDSGLIEISAPELQVTAGAASATTLTPNDTAALLGRLEPLPDLATANASASTMRPPTPPPPRPGAVQPIAFVSPTGKSVSDAPIAPPKQVSPLLPPQISPDGDVRSESEVRIRFSDPMVPVAAVGRPVPAIATITPAVRGTWRWIDSRVATFTTEAPRFAGATEYTVTAPDGVKSLAGGVLQVPATKTFRTPPISITGGFPSVKLRPDSPIVVTFDQDLDPAKLVPLLRVERYPADAPPKAKPRKLAFQAITLAEARQRWKANPAIAIDPAKLDAQLGKHHVVLAPATAWPADSQLQVVLAARAPSREGPLVTTRESFVRFDVAPAFSVRGITCFGVDRPKLDPTCPANGWMAVELSNEVDPVAYRSHKFQIEGEDFEDHFSGGASVGMIAPERVGKQYTVKIGDGLVDVYGQQLVGPQRVSFTTGPERFEAWADVPTGLHVLDPRFQIAQWVLKAEAVPSLRVQLYRVTPADYFAYEDYEAGKRATPPGKLVYDKTHVIGPRHGADVRVDLRPALDGGVGHVVAVATAPKLTPRRAWLQVTKLGLSARFDRDHVNAWVQDITPATKFLSPLPGVATSLLVEGKQDRPTATTDAAGQSQVALFPAPPRPRTTDDRTALLVATSGNDSTFAAIDRFEKAVRVDNALWYVTDDRFMYKPGETVYVKGWVRWTHDGVDPGLALPKPGETVSYMLTDARGTTLASGTAALTDQGGFHAEVKLPANANLGTARFSFSTRRDAYAHMIEIAEFRTPSFAVNLNDDVSHAGALPLVLGESIEMNASAKYYAGGGLAGSKLQWNARLTKTTFQPAGWSLYSFSPVHSRSDRGRHVQAIEATQSTALDSTSASSVVFGLAALPNGRTSVLEVDALVTDVDRTTIRATSRPILVHPSNYYVGVRLAPLTDDQLDLVVTDLDGNPVAGVPIEVTLEGVLYSERWRDDAEIADTQHCKLTSAVTPVRCAFSRKDHKYTYRVLATVHDARGRENATQYDVPWYTMRDDKRDLEIVPDKSSYRPGEVAKLDVRSAVLPATAVVTFARQGVIEQRRLELTKPSTTVELPIAVQYIQNVHVLVDRFAKRRELQKGSTLPLPEDTQAEVDIPVDLEGARLVMKTRSTKKIVEPGANATFEVEVKRDGKPVAGAEVALIVVDEAILSLTNRSHEDPLPGFYRTVEAGTSWLSTLSMVDDSGPELAGAPGFSRYPLDGQGFGSGSGFGSGAGAGGFGTIGHGAGGSGYVESRKDFRANAAFSPVLKTDANGKVSLTVKMPDSLTRFRIVALATSSTYYFGKAESTIVTQRKINARTVAPRFLSQGDRFALPIVVQNLDSAPRTIDVAVRAANLRAIGPAGKRVTIPGGQRAEVRFDFATAERGKAVIQTIAASGDFADASTVELPVYEPATSESFATYGVVDDKPQFERLEVPGEVFPDVGGVEVELSSTQLQSLTDAYWYLYAYPYECAEQRSGRMLATSAIYDMLEAFSTPGRPTRKELEATRANDVRILGKTQNADGGWGYFSSMHSDPFVTMQVVSALAAQKTTGPVVQKSTAFVTKYAATAFAKLEQAAALSPAQRRDRAGYPAQVSLAATALTTLAATGVDVRPRAERLHALATTLEAYPVDAKARLLAIVAKLERAKPMRTKLLGDLVSATHETASSATVTTSYDESERLLLVSSTRTTALALDALLREAPDHPLVPKLARGVLDGRSHGRWRSTQENLVALQTMRQYFDRFEKATPNYTGKLWLGTTTYAEHAFVGRTNTRAQAGADWTTLRPQSTHDLAFVKDGPGRMYYRIGITYAPKRTDLPALDNGFIVRRSYAAIDDPSDVVKTAGGWKIRLGARVLVTLEALNTTKRHGVALVDPVPAGFEIVNDRLATSERSAQVVPDTRWDHTNLRDERAEAFAMTLDEGTHHFTYTARAITPGTFVAAPTKAEEMYSPETFGRSTGASVVIE
ncbi:MAG TPA: alpha-2-macroglobulin family protein [Kofleriaceae bacterium]|nr:alpha-2-macroglobulin family protein [Kofleriaceae bacterium]